MELGSLYTELILEKSRDKSNRRELEHPTHCELGHNPSCGDEITLQLKVLKDAVCFQSISTLPARVKCAVLSWYTLKDMLENDKSEGSFIPD